LGRWIYPSPFFHDASAWPHRSAANVVLHLLLALASINLLIQAMMTTTESLVLIPLLDVFDLTAGQMSFSVSSGDAVQLLRGGADSRI
jgi:hypothetical protein